MEKKALWVVFRPKDPVELKKMREMYLGSYPHFKEMSSLYAKTWWVNEEKNEWGAMYIFNSRKELDEYVASDRWQNKVPEKYGCKPEIQAVLDIGAILFKETVQAGEGSWITSE
jgi:hypothetical protein